MFKEKLASVLNGIRKKVEFLNVEEEEVKRNDEEKYHFYSIDHFESYVFGGKYESEDLLKSKEIRKAINLLLNDCGIDEYYKIIRKHARQKDLGAMIELIGIIEPTLNKFEKGTQDIINSKYENIESMIDKITLLFEEYLSLVESIFSVKSTMNWKVVVLRGYYKYLNFLFYLWVNESLKEKKSINSNVISSREELAKKILKYYGKVKEAETQIHWPSIDENIKADFEKKKFPIISLEDQIIEEVKIFLNTPTTITEVNQYFNI